MLYSTIGQWTYSSRITYSFMPDGTSLGGVPSTLFQTMNAIAPTATWENQIEQAASIWESSANVNLALVPDDGEPLGANGDQQDDPNYGDIRIGAAPLPAGEAAITFLPPPVNGGTGAGDIIFNSNVTWGINGGVDLASVAAHEFGHALGLGESTDSNAVMYGTYNGIKDSLDADDIAGIQSLYGAPQYDQFNQGLVHNSTGLTATNITSYIDGNGQIAIPGLAITTTTQSEWFSVTVPATNSGNMIVTVQSSNLSSLAPQAEIYNSSLKQVAGTSAPATYGATLTQTVPVSAGQKYYIRVAAAGGGYGVIGSYGLEVNFGTQSQPSIAPPNTLVAQQPNGTYPGINAPSSGATQGGVGTDSGGVDFLLLPPGLGESPSGPTGPTPAPGGPCPSPAPGAPTPGGSSPSPAPGGPILALPPLGLVLQAVDQTLSGWDNQIGWLTGLLDPADSSLEST